MTGFELVTSAHAQAGGAPPGGGFGAFVPILLMFVVFYFLLIRPQQKRVREHENLVKVLERGDDVVTQGGIHGKIVALTDDTATLEICDKTQTRMRVDRSSVQRRKNEPKSE